MRALLAPLALFFCGCSSLFAPFSSDNPDNCNHYPEVCGPQQVCDESLGRCVTPEFFSASVDCSAMALIAALQSAMAQADSSLTLTPGCIYTLSTANNFWYGPNALPPIASNVTIEGNGATIRRDGAAPKMRLFFVAGPPTPTPAVGGQWGLNPGSLTLRNLTLRDGLARGGKGGSGTVAGGGGAGLGGAIFAQGAVTLAGVTLTANRAEGGDGGGPGSTNPGGGGGLGGDGGSGGSHRGSGGGFRGNGESSGGQAGGFLGGEGGLGSGAPGVGMGAEPGSPGTYGSLTVVNSTLAENTARGGLGAPTPSGQAGGHGRGLGGAIFNLNGAPV